VNFASCHLFGGVSAAIYSVGILPSFFLVGIFLPIRCATTSTTRLGQGPMTIPQVLSAPPPTVLSCTDRVALRPVCAETHLASRVPAAMAPAFFVCIPFFLMNCDYFFFLIVRLLFFVTSQHPVLRGTIPLLLGPLPWLAHRPSLTALLAISPITRLLFANGMESAVIGIRIHVNRSTAPLAELIR